MEDKLSSENPHGLANEVTTTTKIIYEKVSF